MKVYSKNFCNKFPWVRSNYFYFSKSNRRSFHTNHSPISFSIAIITKFCSIIIITSSFSSSIVSEEHKRIVYLMHISYIRMYIIHGIDTIKRSYSNNEASVCMFNRKWIEIIRYWPLRLENVVNGLNGIHTYTQFVDVRRFEPFTKWS